MEMKALVNRPLPRRKRLIFCLEYYYQLAPSVVEALMDFANW